MRHRNMGRSGLQVSAIGLGCNTFGSALDAAGAQAVVDAALEEGVTFFDTADCYGESESMLGAALARCRDEVVIATKFGFALARGPMRSGASRKYVAQACEASLRRLGTDHIDLYYQHFPDPLVPIDETVAALDKLVADGKVLYAGVSNFYAWQLVDALHAARGHPGLQVVAQQVMWNLLDRGVEREIVPACQAHGVGIVAFQPLAAGMLTGKYRRGEAPPAGSRLATVPRLAEINLTEANFTPVERLAEWCRQRGRDMAEVALAWLLTHDAVASVIVGATAPGHVRRNAAAASWEMSQDDAASLRALLAELGPPPDVWERRLATFEEGRA